MNPDPPARLNGYQVDQASGRSPFSVLALGWLSVLSFLLAVYASVFLLGKGMLTICFLSYEAFVVLFVAYLIAKLLNRHPRCGRCQQIMDVIEVNWTGDQWRDIQGYELVGGLVGADGYLYETDRTKETGRLPECSIWSQLQVWCACHRCRLCVLRMRHSRSRLFATRDDGAFEQAKQLLLTDPAAGEKIGQTYRESLEAKQESVDSDSRD